MTIAFVLILIALVLFVVYTLFSGEEKKINEKSAPRGKIQEYCAEGKEERRKYQRFDIELELKYNLVSASKSIYSTSSKNVSKGGISLLVYEILPKDSLIEMEISVPGEKNVLRAKGRVVWCEDQNSPEHLDKTGKRTFTAGIEFVDTDKNEKSILMDYINKHQTQK